jgi:hypothetical protein
MASISNSRLRAIHISTCSKVNSRYAAATYEVRSEHATLQEEFVIALQMIDSICEVIGGLGDACELVGSQGVDVLVERATGM